MALETAEPGFQFEHHFEVVGKRLANAKAVSSRGVDVHRGGNTMSIELLVVVQAVSGRHSTVVVSQREETARAILRDVLLVAILVDQLLLRTFS